MKTIINYCPRCKNASLEIFAGLITGQYHCKKCGYIGSLIIQKEIKEKKIVLPLNKSNK